MAKFAGRWRSDRHNLTLDVSRCGDGWCGVKVAADRTCGGIALRLNALEQGDGHARLEGQLELAPGSEPYRVQATLFRKDDGLLDLTVHGNTGPEFQAWRRTFPFQAVFARVSDAACPPNAKVSGLRG